MEFTISIKELKKMIAKGDVDHVFLVLGIMDVMAVQLSERWTNNQKEYNLGVLRRTEYLAERNSIVRSLLNIVDQSAKSVAYNNNIFDISSFSRLIKVDINDIDNTLGNLESTSYSKIVELSSSIENFQDIDSDVSKYEDIILNEIKENHPTVKVDNWYDRPIKDKIKISVPFLFFKWEREMDVSDFKVPKDWKGFKELFMK